MVDPPPYPGLPRWVKISGIVGGLLLLLLVVAMFAGAGPGRHGPGRHFSSGNEVSETPRPDAVGPAATESRASDGAHSEDRH